MDFNNKCVAIFSVTRTRGKKKVLMLTYSPPTQEDDLPRFRAKSRTGAVRESEWVIAHTIFHRNGWVGWGSPEMFAFGVSLGYDRSSLVTELTKSRHYLSKNNGKT